VAGEAVKILCPRCPLCDGPASREMPASAVQAWCENPDCTAMCWNPSRSLDDNLLESKVHQLPDWLT
jgi:hypothetical protein